MEIEKYNLLCFFTFFWAVDSHKYCITWQLIILYEVLLFLYLRLQQSSYYKIKEKKPNQTNNTAAVAYRF